MTVAIACYIAIFCSIAFFTLWFRVCYRDLVYKKHEVMAAEEQVKMHRNLYMKERGGGNEEVAKRMLDTSRIIYQKTVKGYNIKLKKPLYYFPGRVMGFRLIGEEN